MSFVCLVGCERVELPSSTVSSQDEEEKENDGEGDECDDELLFDTLWGYWYSIDVESGLVMDSLEYDSAQSVVRSGKGSYEEPFTVYAFTGGIVYRSLLEGDVSSIYDIWTTGYIVGYISGRSISKTIFGTGNVATNIVLADSPDESDYRRCIPVQLSSSSSFSAVRDAINLRENPDMLGRKVLIFGTATQYMRYFGMKDVKYYDCL
ncbi:MAG: DUF6359 domain-containing protein [Bacteroidaceae bacterium]|nr:DUF6359 domain-containing protein [Bacteroidaceae bacterium]